MDRGAATLDEAAMTDTKQDWKSEAIEFVAIVLWGRFAPSHHLAWADEPHRSEYIEAAKAAIEEYEDHRVRDWLSDE